MARGYVNTQLNCIEADLVSLSGQVEAVFANLGSLGDIFRAAVSGGEMSMEGLPADIIADLKEAFNGVAEMAPGVFMMGGPAIRVASGASSTAFRALVIGRLFAAAAEKGNRTAALVKADLAKLAFLMEKMDLLKKQKELLKNDLCVMRAA